MTSRASSDVVTGDPNTERAETVKCAWCGKFISYADMESGAASFHFEPDNHFGPEISEWSCESCNDPVERYKRASQGA